MGIELSPKGKRIAKARKRRNEHMPKAGPVTIRKADGTVIVEQPLMGHISQVPKRK